MFQGSWEYGVLEGKVKKLEGKGNCVPRELGVRSVRGKSEQNFEGKGNRWTCGAKV